MSGLAGKVLLVVDDDRFFCDLVRTHFTGRGQVVHVDAPKAHVIARCLNESEDCAVTAAGKAHLHMVLILSKEGNLAMAKIRMESVIQEAAAAFR